MTVSCSIVLLQGAEAEEDRPLPGSLPAELPNGRVPTLESSKGWGPPGAAQEDQAATQAAAYGRLTSVCNFVHMLQCDMAGSKASRWEM